MSVRLYHHYVGKLGRTSVEVLVCLLTMVDDIRNSLTMYKLGWQLGYFQSIRSPTPTVKGLFSSLRFRLPSACLLFVFVASFL